MMTSRAEQETVIIYDVEKGKWHIYTNYPPHVRKYAIYRDKSENNRISDDELDVWVNNKQFSSSFSVRERRQLTEEQRKATAERLKKARSGDEE